MSSPNRSTSDIEDTFSSMNILNYISVSSDYFPASAGSSSFNSSENAKDNIIPPVFSSFYNNPYKMYLKHHEKQVEDILNYLDELYLYHIEKMEEGRINGYHSYYALSYVDRMSPKRTSTSETPAITLAAIQQLINDGISSTLKAQATAMATSDNSNRNTEPREIPPMGIEQANQITWTELKWLLTNKYYPRTEIRKMEDEFYGITVNGSDLKTYIRRFQELTILCPNMVPNSEKLMEAFIGGLPQSIEGNVTASKPQTLEEAINISQRLMDQIIKRDSVQETNDHKRKLEDKGNIVNNNNYQNNYNNNNRNDDYHRQQNRRQETFKIYTATNGYTGNRPLCERCTLHHIGPCTVKCRTCNRVGHLTKNCRNKTTRNNLQTVSVTCNACGKKGHYANQCSKANNRATGKHT
ncbi:reverse transcriptase domain-containing protein [Tanacetum coccineum]